MLSWESHLLGQLERHRADIYERLYRAAPAARRGRDYDMSNFSGEYISLSEGIDVIQPLASGVSHSLTAAAVSNVIISLGGVEFGLSSPPRARPSRRYYRAKIFTCERRGPKLVVCVSFPSHNIYFVSFLISISFDDDEDRQIC